jgi:ribosomal protein L12E/L44/L45/RPP1/RPP2
LAGLQVRGIDVKALLSKLGVDIDEVLQTLGQKPQTPVEAEKEE